MMSEANGYARPEDIFKPLKRDFKVVEIEGLGKFRLRTLNAKEAAEFAAAKFNKLGELNRSALVKNNAIAIQLVCVDADGNQVFSKEDISRLLELPAGPVTALAQACLKHSGLAEEDEAKN